MRTLITGGTGFLGGHLATELRARGHDVVVAGGPSDHHDAPLHVNIVSQSDVEHVIGDTHADVVYHLAGQASVANAFREPMETFEVNAVGTLRVFEAVRRLNGRKPLVIVASSAEVYGAQSIEDLPFPESLLPRPITPYAASKVAAEAIAITSFRTYAVPTIIFRSFNTIGPGQDRRFAIPSFAHQLAEISRGADPLLLVGDLTVARDFLDVRDAAVALALLGERGTPGETYNICSGQPSSVQEVLRQLISIARVPVEVREDPSRRRNDDSPAIYGDNSKIRHEVGWSPKIPLRVSLRDTFEEAVRSLALVR